MEWTDKLGLLSMPLEVHDRRTASFREAFRRNSFFAETGRNFIVFNDQDLSDEPVSDADIRPLQAIGSYAKECVNQAWSTDCQWYFVVLPHGIALVNAESKNGFLCRKKSAKFIDAFLDAPMKRAIRKSKKRNKN